MSPLLQMKSFSQSQVPEFAVIVVAMIDWDINDECLGHAPGEVAAVNLSSQDSSGCLKPFSLSHKPYVSLLMGVGQSESMMCCIIREQIKQQW